MRNFVFKKYLVSLYEIFYEMKRLLILRTKYRLHIMSPEKTIRYIMKHQCSIARFGDGEFDLIFQTRDLGFQTKSTELAAMLCDVLKRDQSNLLLCIPHCMNSTKGCNAHSKNFWIYWGKKNNHQQNIVNMIRKYAGRKYRFGDSQITRPYIDWKNDRRAKRTYPMLKKIWEGKRVLLIEGEQTRMGVGNDLFDGAESLQRILAPAVGAFSARKEIKDTIMRYYDGQLIVMALGPTATILAAEFANAGIQALDIGNLDIEYEWFRMHAKERVAIPGKFTNEADKGRVYSECNDATYLNQIIARVEC